MKSRQIFKILSLCTLLAIYSPLPGQDAVSCSEDSLFSVLDFWIGEWEVLDTSGTLVGKKRVAKVLDSCAVTEYWRGAGGSEGRSLFYVDNSNRQWKQVWVTSSATLPWGQKEKTMISSPNDKTVIFQGSYQVQGKSILDRTILTPISPDSVTQEIQISADDGVNWKTNFLGYYMRIKGTDSHETW
ncbi:MAG: hypothetical protein GF372_08040 [Candidatus Marinimicrobia bacterium]|nr:hypothetical protein [Candidatus Neomarinimicrobiota bacterium]